MDPADFCVEILDELGVALKGSFIVADSSEVKKVDEPEPAQPSSQGSALGNSQQQKNLKEQAFSVARFFKDPKFEGIQYASIAKIRSDMVAGGVSPSVLHHFKLQLEDRSDRYEIGRLDLKHDSFLGIQICTYDQCAFLSLSVYWQNQIGIFIQLFSYQWFVGLEYQT